MPRERVAIIDATGAALGTSTVSSVSVLKVDVVKTVGGAASSPATGTSSNIASSVTNVTVFASNSSAKGRTVFNDSTANLFLILGATASATSFTIKIAAAGYYEVPYSYTGQVDGIWDVANGFARITELT